MWRPLWVACIGSREISAAKIDISRTLGDWIVRCGHSLVSGNAPGADQAFAHGANEVDPSRVYLQLPWPKFEREAIRPGNHVKVFTELPEAEQNWYLQYTQEFHPAWGRLSQGAKKLMARNAMIMLPCGCHPVDLCLAWPSQKPGGGGTGQGMRIAQKQGIELIDLNHQSRHDLHLLCERLAGRRE